jgi:hypothetical protein
LAKAALGYSGCSFFFLALFAGACGHAETHSAQVRAAPPVDPNADPAPPQRPPADGRAQLNTEYYLGSEEEERAQFAEFAKRIQELQRKSSSEHGQPLQRGFHAKSHACLRGELRLDPQRDPRARYGVFADGQPNRDVVVRFSNGVGWKQDDGALDARGMAVKVLGVPGPKYLPDEPTTQDFLMTNSPTPVGRDAVEFMEFARANVSGRVAEMFFAFGHASTGAAALARTGPVSSMVTQQYWSGGAYHLGAHQAVKYSARPCDLRMERHPDRSSPDYLRQDLADAARGGICMRFLVQFQADPQTTPIENASKAWEEADAPFVTVARVVMPPQTVPSDPASVAACDALAYTPWHAIPAHKPMGHINRARRYVYEASQQARHAQPLR